LLVILIKTKKVYKINALIIFLIFNYYIFTSDYQLMDDLHIGVTTSRGTVISYDWNGISENSNNWQECLVVFQLNDHSWEIQWDSILADTVKNSCWNSARLNFKWIMFNSSKLIYLWDLLVWHLLSYYFVCKYNKLYVIITSCILVV